MLTFQTVVAVATVHVTPTPPKASERQKIQMVREENVLAGEVELPNSNIELCQRHVWSRLVAGREKARSGDGPNWA